LAHDWKWEMILLMLKQWSPCFYSYSKMNDIAPVSMKCLSLPLDFWSPSMEAQPHLDQCQKEIGKSIKDFALSLQYPSFDFENFGIVYSFGDSC
jgi:hypothetical protein